MNIAQLPPLQCLFLQHMFSQYVKLTVTDSFFFFPHYFSVILGGHVYLN